jgi:hypothetical protein
MLKHKILKAPTFLFNWETINHLANPQKRDITGVHNNYHPISLVCKFALKIHYTNAKHMRTFIKPTLVVFNVVSSQRAPQKRV